LKVDASHPSKGLLAGAGALLRRLGVRGRLLLAFLGISAFAVIAAAAAMYSFAEVGKVPGRITQERVGQDDHPGAAESSAGLGQAVESPRGAERWRPPAS
jgi:hypothetical protein